MGKKILRAGSHEVTSGSSSPPQPPTGAVSAPAPDQREFQGHVYTRLDLVLAAVEPRLALQAELLAALKVCAFRLGAINLAYGVFNEADAKALDEANAAIAKAEGR